MNHLGTIFLIVLVVLLLVGSVWGGGEVASVGERFGKLADISLGLFLLFSVVWFMAFVIGNLFKGL